MNDALTFLLYSILGIFCLAIILGVCFHIVRQMVGILAYFTYAGLLYIESFIPIKLHIPQKGVKRLAMDICGTLFIGITVQSIWVFMLHPNEKFIEFLPRYISPLAAILAIACLAIIYLLGSKSKSIEDDKDEWFDKLDKLSVPKFIKFLS